MVQIVIAVGLTGYLSIRNGQKAVRDLAQQSIADTSKQVDSKLNNYLNTPHLVNRINSDAFDLGILDISPQGNPILAQHFLQQLQNFEDLIWIVFATEEPNYVDITFATEEPNHEESNNINTKDRGDRILTQMWNTEAGIGLLRFKFDTANDKNSNLPRLIEDGSSPDYDHRKRPWYQAATQQSVEQPEYWTEIYPTITPQSLVISAGRTLYNPEQEFTGVISADLSLSGIGNFLRDIKIGENGRIFIIERNGLLVGTSVDEQPFRLNSNEEKLERIALTALNDPFAQASAQYLSEQFGQLDRIETEQQLQFRWEGENQYLQVFPYGDKRGVGIDWLIVTVVPERDFMAQIYVNTRNTILLMLLSLAGAVAMGLYTSRWISRPILRLVQSSQAMSRGDLDQKVPEGAIAELNILSQAFNSMATQLKTEFANLEQKVQERTLSLEERTSELEVAKEKAEVANHAKGSFIANMSHELRSPLNAILGFAQIMTRSQTLSREHQENISIIHRSGEHLLSLINNVLDLSKIEAGKTTFNEKNFDLYRLLNDIHDMFQLKAEEKELHLLLEREDNVPRYIRTDEVKLRQVLINLLNNAIKFTEEGSVTLSVTSYQSNNQQQTTNNQQPTTKIHFAVEDTGAGIAPEELDKLFQAFVQTETGKQAQEGTGLGLPISRKFVQLMGGDIQVTSKVGNGTTFRFEILVEEVEATTVESQKNKRRVIALAPDQPCYRILIVDDKVFNRQLFVKLLNPLGFELKEANNGKEAVEICESWQPYLIWMDMRMPIMDGYEATQRIKATTKGQAIAVIALTASVLEEEKAVVLSAGCNDFMRKPFREQDIFEALQKHIGVRFIYEELEETSSKEETEESIQVKMRELPQPLKDELKIAIVVGNLGGISSTIAEIRQFDDSLAEVLQKSCDRFEFQKVLHWLSD
ncbi:MAG: ATP-binding protein [Cyanobacteria bacterium P01_E01_bin.42]